MCLQLAKAPPAPAAPSQRALKSQCCLLLLVVASSRPPTDEASVRLNLHLPYTRPRPRPSRPSVLLLFQFIFFPYIVGSYCNCCASSPSHLVTLNLWTLLHYCCSRHLQKQKDKALCCLSPLSSPPPASTSTIRLDAQLCAHSKTSWPTSRDERSSRFSTKISLLMRDIPLPRSWDRVHMALFGKLEQSFAARSKAARSSSRCDTPPQDDTRCLHGANLGLLFSAAVNNQTNEGVAIKKVTNVFSKKILAKRALREIKLLQHFRGHRNVRLFRTPSHKSIDRVSGQGNTLTRPLKDHMFV